MFMVSGALGLKIIVNVLYLIFIMSYNLWVCKYMGLNHFGVCYLSSLLVFVLFQAFVKGGELSEGVV